MGFITESEALGTPVVAKSGTTAMPGNWISEEDATGMPPVPPKPTTLDRIAGGAKQALQEVKALANMFVGIPGGAAGVAMDVSSRITSLATGVPPKEAGLRARAESEHVNQLWGKVTDALMLQQDATGSKIEEWMGKGMEYSDIAGAKAETATGGIVSKETVQSVRDTLLNALGVKGLAWKPKGGKFAPPKPEMLEDIAAGTATPDHVKILVDHAVENRIPLEQVWTKTPGKTPPGSSPAWEAMVKGLVEEKPIEGVPPIEMPVKVPQGPGITPKVKITEPTVIGEAPDFAASGIDKLRQGLLISKDEAKAIRRLTPRPDEGTIVNVEGKPYFQKGAADPALLKVLGIMGMGAVAGTALYNWYSSGEVSGDNALGLGGASLAIAGGVRLKGEGTFYAKTVATLAEPLANAFAPPNPLRAWDSTVPAVANPGQSWATNAVKTYLDRHAGTPTDPIRELKLPDGTKWEDITDELAKKTYIPGAKGPETYWDLSKYYDGHTTDFKAREQLEDKLHSYLSHVGDYVKSRNLTPAQLQQLDLPRAIRETVANDQKIAAQAIKEFNKPDPVRVAETESLPTYKAYAPVKEGARDFSFNRDGSIQKTDSVKLQPGEVSYAWKELKVPEQLTEEQAKTVRPATEAEIKDFASGDSSLDVQELLGQNLVVATDAKGKVIQDNFSQRPALGSTPQEAYFAGQLAKEGNSLGHCVGGYAEDVIGGQSRILSLRDQHGRSYATVEIVVDSGSVQGAPYFPPRLPSESIAQIKGPGNGAPAEYVKPYIQDLVKSGKWGDVRDLEHAGLTKWKDQFLTQDEIKNLPNQESEAFSGRNPQRGAVDNKLLLRIAGGSAALAYLLADHPDDKFTTLAASLAGAAIIHKAGKFEGMPEGKILETYRAGGREGEAAAAKIYEDTHRQLTRSVAQMGKDLPVEDIVQRTYEKAFRTLKLPESDPRAFKGEAKVSTYLHAIAQNEAKTGWRAEKSRPQTTSLEIDPETGGTSVPEKYMMEQNPEKYQSAQDVAARNMLAEKMQGAIDKLPEDHQKVFDAVEMRGLSYEEAAAELGIPINTVRTRLFRAKENLQRSLREYNTPGMKGHLEAGKADPKTLAKIGLVSAGAVIGSQINEKNPVLGGLAGAAGGFGAAALFHLSPKGAAEAIAKAFESDKRIRVDQFADAHDAGMATAERAIWQQARAVAQAAPKEADLNLITTAIQHNAIAQLPERLQAPAQIARNFFAEMAQQGTKSGVLKDLIDDYVTNLWDLTGKNKEVWDGIVSRAGGPSMSPESRFALKRQIANLEVGKKLGLTPLTENVAQIMSIYGKSLARSIENAKMIKSLKDATDPTTGLKLLIGSEKAPHGYVSIDSPQLSGMRVHPDIAPSLKFIFDRENSGVVLQGIQAMNTAVKRSAVMLSLFHAKALLDGFTGAMDLNKKMIATGAGVGAAYGLADDKNPLPYALIGAGTAMMAAGGKTVGQAAAPKLFGENIYLKQLREGKAGDLVGELLNSGLKVSLEKGKLVDEDIGGSFYTGMTALQKGLDAVLPGTGLPIKGLIELNHGVDGFMWERLHAGMKLTVAAQKLEQLVMNNAKAHAKDPSVELKSRAELAAQASSFTNDIFGGLNWRKIAEDTHSKLGRDLALQVYSPSGRRVAQLAIFAPDWTVSTTRAATQAFSPSMTDLNPVKLAKTFTEPQNAIGLHRQYMVRSALYYATVANGINYALSGHYVWDNKDWTTIDLGDGRTMQWSKHMMEPIHWITKSAQQAANKLGFIPKETITQLTGKEYISAYGRSPPMDTSVGGRLAHMGKSVTPISAQGAFSGEASVGGAVSSVLGVPIYGKTLTERTEAKAALKALHKTEAYKKLQAERKAAQK